MAFVNMYKKCGIKQIRANKKLFFFKMREFEICQTADGARNLNYSMVPAKASMIGGF